MKSYWKDIVTASNQWIGLELFVENHPRSTFHIESGGESRFKIMMGDFPLIWGTLEKEHYGVWLLRNPIEWTRNQMPISPITSFEVEKTKGFSPTESMKYWTRFFAKSLSKEESTFLYTGKWKLIPKSFSINSLSLHQLLNYQEIDYLDWQLSGHGGLVVLKKEMPKKHGRLKWWRKQIKVGNRIPILAWYIGCLDAYLIIDGHLRLQAYQLEDIKPPVLTICSIYEIPIPADKEVQKRVWESLQKRSENPRKTPLNQDEVNNVLIQVYGNQSFQREFTKSQYQHNFEEKWLAEVKKAGENLTGEMKSDLQWMINRDY